jgi:hypothetical protein
VFTQGSNAFGLTNGVAVVDDADHRVAVLIGGAGQALSTTALPIGHNFTSAAASPDGSTLFVLSSGDWPRKSVTDDPPSLTVVSNKTFQPSAVRYTMSQPLASLAIDPLGRYVVAYQGSGSTAVFTQNPNEVVIFDLNRAPSAGSAGQPPNPVSRTIRSFGGTPQRLTFTPALNLPVNAPSRTARRLLILETQIDVTFVDLDHAFDVPTPRPDITVRLTSGTSAHSVAPGGVVVDGNVDDGRIALRTQNDTNVYTIQLLAAQGASSASPNANDFNPAINLTDVGGNPSDIAFVRTDQGLRVAALVPSRSEAVLVEPDTSATTHVSLSAQYTNLSLVTNVVNATSPTDVALLWSGASGVASGVALWALGVTVGQPYRSIEVLDIAEPIQAVDSVPGTNQRLKVLKTISGGDFFVLDLLQRTAAPLHTTSAASLSIAPDGLRMWAFAVGGTNLASIDFATLNPVPLTTNLPIAAAFDVANRDGGRSLISLHTQGTLGATVFDALHPDTATSRQTPAILLEGP